jgi:hypothetical protein
MKGHKVQRRPSTNKMREEQNSVVGTNQRLMAGGTNQSAISISAASIVQQNTQQFQQFQQLNKPPMGGAMGQTGRGPQGRNTNGKAQFSSQVPLTASGHPVAQNSGLRQGTIQQIIGSQQNSQQMLAQQQKYPPRR